MIVELFGPPAAGKTTFARALVACMRAAGQPAELVSSYRPAERDPSPAARGTLGPSVVRRLARPVVELASLARDRAGPGQDEPVAATLLRMFPPRSLLWSIRLRQYLRRLGASWHACASSPETVVFDQGFVQAVGSLVLLARDPAAQAIGPALDLIPRPDLLVSIETPPALLERRLIDRASGLSRAERLLELDLATNLRSVRILGDLQAELRRQAGPAIVMVDGTDGATMAEGARRVTAAIAGGGSKARGPAPAVTRAVVLGA